MIFKNPVDRGLTRAGLSVYQGNIPSVAAGPQQAPKMPKAPSVAVAVKKGFYRRLEGEVTASIAVLCWDDDVNRQGRIDVQNIINRIVYGLMEKHSTIDQSFILCQNTEKEDSVEFELVEDPNVDFHPFYLGWVSAKFGIASPGPDDAPYNDVGPDTLQWVGPAGLDAVMAAAALTDVNIPTVGILTTSGSITGGGPMTGNLTILLEGDSLTPGNLMLYGTDSNGVKGWYSQPIGGGGSGGTSVGSDSITGSTTLSLVGDSGNPGDSTFYGTNSSGVRGWYSQTSYLTTGATFTIPALGATVDVTVASAADIVVGQAHVITDGTVFIFGSVTAIASLVVTYANQGGGGAVSGTMGTCHIYMGGVDPPIPNNTSTFLRGDNAYAQVAYANVTGTPSIPTVGTLTTSDSITGGGAMTGNLTVTLVNDSASPGNNQVYGTSSSGVLGYRAISSLPVAYSSVTGTPTAPVALTSTVGGLTPNVTPNDATKVLRGDGAWGTLAYTSISGTPAAPVALTSTVGGLTPNVTPNSASQVLLGSGAWGTLAYSSVSGIPTLGTSASKDIPASGNASATQVVYGSDTRLSDSRTPTAHATSHKSGGSDAIALDTLAVSTDITALNASSSAHGLLAKVSGTSTDFVGGDNACHAHTVVPLDTLGATTDITSLNANSSAHGLMPKADGSASHFYSSDGTQKSVAYANLTGAPVSDPFTTTTSSFTIPAAGSPVTLAITSSSWPAVGQVLEINDGTHYGFFEVTTVTSGISIAVTNRGYNGNPVSGTMATAASVSLASPGQATSTQSGFVPTPSGTATDFFGGDSAFHAHSTVALDTLGACTDITTRNASSSQHGLLVKVSGTATDFVGGDNACHAHTTVPLDTLGATTDITTLNSSISAHGLLKKLDNTVTHYMDGTGNWSTPQASKPWRVWTAADGFPNATAYPAWATINTTPYLSYAASVVSTQCFLHRVPSTAILTSGVIIRLTWASASATTGNVVWGVAIENFGVATVISDHFDTQTTATTAVGGVVSITTETAITETNNTLSTGQVFRLQVQRVGTSGSDTMAGAAQLFAVSIESAV